MAYYNPEMIIYGHGKCMPPPSILAAPWPGLCLFSHHHPLFSSPSSGGCLTDNFSEHRLSLYKYRIGDWFDVL